MEKQHRDMGGEELLMTSTTLACALAQCMDNHEIAEFCELLMLIRHDLEIIKCRRHDR